MSVSIKILGIDVGSVKICAAMAEQTDDLSVRFIAVVNTESKGIKKGSITNIELAANSIKVAVDEVLRKAGTKYDKVVVGISGKDIKESDCNYVMNIPDGEVTIKQIERAVHSAEWKAKTPQDYEIVHTLPYNFKIDEQQDGIEDPLGMNGSRLEVEAYNIAVQKSTLTNLKKALEKAGLKADNIVLSAYASAIATLNDDEKTLGAALIDAGGDTCNLVVHLGNSLRHSNFLAVGSSNITSDLSSVLHIPLNEAEDIKIRFDSLIAGDQDSIEVQDLGDENSTQTVSIDTTKSVIFARIDETLGFLAKMLNDGGYLKDSIGAGIVLTGGGFAKISYTKKIAQDWFEMPVRIARPIKFDGLSELDRDPANSCAIGLCLYGAGHFTPYEIDSTRKLRYRGEPVQISNINKDFMSIDDVEEKIEEERTEEKPTVDLRLDSGDILNSGIDKRREIGKLNFFAKFLEWFKHLF